MTPEEIALAIQAFIELEPEAQKGIMAALKGVVGLVHLLHKPKPVIAAPVLVPPPATPSGE